MGLYRTLQPIVYLVDGVATSVKTGRIIELTSAQADDLEGAITYVGFDNSEEELPFADLLYYDSPSEFPAVGVQDGFFYLSLSTGYFYRWDDDLEDYVIVSQEIDLTDIPITGTVSEFNSALESADFYTTGGTDVSVTDGGTGRSTGTTAYALIATGTTATGAQQTLATGATDEILVGGGASALPVWTTATGSGAPVRATSPTLATPKIDASDTTLSRSAAGVAAIEGFDVVTRSVVTVNGSSTLAAVGAREYIVLLQSGAVPTMPTAVSNTSIYHIKNTHSSTITLASTSSQTFDGAASPLSILPNECYTLVSNNSNWVII